MTQPLYTWCIRGWSRKCFCVSSHDANWAQTVREKVVCRSLMGKNTVCSWMTGVEWILGSKLVCPLLTYLRRSLKQEQKISSVWNWNEFKFECSRVLHRAIFFLGGGYYVLQSGESAPRGSRVSTFTLTTESHFVAFNVWTLTNANKCTTQSHSEENEFWLAVKRNVSYPNWKHIPLFLGDRRQCSRFLPHLTPIRAVVIRQHSSVF